MRCWKRQRRPKPVTQEMIWKHLRSPGEVVLDGAFRTLGWFVFIVFALSLGANILKRYEVITPEEAAKYEVVKFDDKRGDRRSGPYPHSYSPTYTPPYTSSSSFSNAGAPGSSTWSVGRSTSAGASGVRGR